MEKETVRATFGKREGYHKVTIDDEYLLLDSKHYETMEHSWTRPDGWVFKDDKGNIIDTTKVTLVKEEYA